MEGFKIKLNKIFFLALFSLVISIFLNFLAYAETNNIQDVPSCEVNELDSKAKVIVENMESLDAVIVLGGERKTFYRLNYAYNLYRNIETLKNISPYIIIAGNSSGFYSYEFNETDSGLMRNNFISCGIDEKVIFIEEESLDTLANFYYIEPILKELNVTDAAIVTDAYHIKRAIWSAKFVLGRNYTFYPFATSKKGSFTEKLKEFGIISSQKLDLFIFGIKPGNRSSFKNYLETKHPFHAPKTGNNPPFSFYKVGVSFYSPLKK